nr:FdrA family protein [Planomonospora venezuelensis]
MRVSQALSGLPGVEVAVVAMATELNLGIAAELGFALPAAGPADLLVALRAVDEAAAGRAAAELDRLLADLSLRAAGPAAAEHPPRTVRSALRSALGDTALGDTAPGDTAPGDTAPGDTAGDASGDPAAGRRATLVLVSVPGPHAFAEALDAVEAGCSVMIFSDNVPVEQEVLLKRRAGELGVLVMGPDCGTAVVGGTGLGFANVLRPGPVGVVAASGTGAQQVACLLDLAGVGVSHVLGVGGRDLSAEVGGASTLRALDALDADPATGLIVLISKPPAPEVAQAVREAAGKLATPVVTAFLGPGQDDLTAAAGNVLRALGGEVPEWPSWTGGDGRPAPGGGGAAADGAAADGAAADGAAADGAAADGAAADGAAADGADPPRPGRTLRGIYSGGTLCAEARLIAGAGEFTDYGDDAYTRGRAHPMIDPALRLEALSAAAPGEVVLLDVVLGHGADPDPAVRLAPAIAAAVSRGVPVVVALVGSTGDPQGLEAQAGALREAGADVFASNARAARHAARLADAR